MAGRTDADVATPWRIWLVGAFALVLAVITFPAFKVHVIENIPSVVRYADTGRGPGWFVWASLYIGAEILIASICVVSVRLEGRPLADVGLTPPPSPWWWRTLAGVGVVAAVILVLRHLEVLTIVARPGQELGVLVASTTWQRLGIIASSALVVPIEELIWRGFAITRLQRLGLPTWAAVALPSLAFGYFHGGTVDTLSISALVAIGVAGLSIVFLRTRSLAWPILLHFSWNVLLVSVTPAPR